MTLEKEFLRPPTELPLKLVIAYVARCRAALPDIKTAANLEDYGSVGVFGHRLRGTGGAYGFSIITEIGAQIEDAARLLDRSEVCRQLDALENYLARIEIVSD